MPNIEMWGFGPINSELHFVNALADGVYSAIRKQLNKESFQDDYVITMVPSFCFNGEGAKKPFVRICSSEQVHTGRIIQILEQIQKDEGIKFDIEIQPLECFIPAVK
ncbi:MAG: hypothetical protein NTX00_00820 [Candidatus Parcubacteria bacterium]|nr:hypothetical protein [Candidatus Parcubacteria bacterium]